MTSPAVRAWVRDEARPVAVTPGAAPLELPPSLTGARIVGVASAVRSARELVTATHTILRSLVVGAGFRAVMIEGTDSVADALDHHVRSGDGDPATLLSDGQGFVRFSEVLAAVTWLRDWTREHPHDPISVVHDRTAPRGGETSLRQVEEHLARRDLAWLTATGQRLVHWGGTAHLVVGDPRTVPPEQTHPNAGGLLRRELGAGYAVVGLTVGTGSAPFPVPPPPRDYVEHAFADLAGPAMLDLATTEHAATDLAATEHLPAPVRAWLRRPLRTRMIGPAYDPARDRDARVDAGPLTDALDAILHVPRFAAATPLPPRPS